MHYRVDIYRPHPDSDNTFKRLWIAEDAQYLDQIPAWLMRQMRACGTPGTFALVIAVDGTEETVLERWRVDSNGRVLRAVYDVRERELEQRGE